MKFAQRLRELRKECGLKQCEVSKKLNYGYTAISNYESGRNEPSLNDLIKISQMFDVSVDYLIGASETRIGFEHKETEKTIRCFVEYYCSSPEPIKKSLDNILLSLVKLGRYRNL